MPGLLIDTEKCVGCGRCVRACANGGVRIEGEKRERRAVATGDCVYCGACVDACPVGAIAIDRGEAAGAVDLDSYHGIWVFAQVGADGAVAPVAFELLARARELAAARGCDVTAVLGEGAEPVAAAEPATGAEPAAAAEPAADAPSDNAAQLIAAGADRVLRCRDERLAGNDAECFARLICDLVREHRPEIILYGATNFGRELAPGVAVRLRTGLTADCTVLAIDEETGLLHQTRPAFGGNLMATIMCPAHRPQMATVRPGIFKAAEPDPARTGEVVDVELAADVQPRVQVLEHATPSDEPSITDAKRLVVVGRGIGGKKNLKLMRRLADAFGAELGCTRPVVEAGWLEYRHQVGQTGVSVAPELLVSVGVSGAIQHLAGISGAECVVAINEDPDAPIFGAANYAVVGDAIEVVEALLAELEA